MVKVNKLRYECYKCKERFASWQARDSHDDMAHRPPRKTTERANFGEESHTLINGKNLALGDVVWLGRKTVITEITKTEGSGDVSVVLKITKKWYSPEEIS
jgi:hypothetical protein